MFLLITIVLTAIIFLLHNLFNKYDYWSKRGVPNPKPLPFFGNLKTLLFQEETPIEFFDKLYKQYKNDPYIGIYKIGQPALYLRDPELIKYVIIKNFNHFQYNDLFCKETELFGQNPFLLNGEEWKIRRSQITPSLTPVKLKVMFELMKKVSNDLITYIATDALEKDVKGIELSTRFMTDNYTSCVFGIAGRSFETNIKNSLFELDNQICSTPTWHRFKKFCLYIKPGWARLLRHKYFTNDVHSYHINTVKETLNYRSRNNIVRNDFFDYMHKSLQNQQGKESIEELLAIHAATVFVDGVETASLTMGFVLHELAKNVEIQDRLRWEVQTMLEEIDNNWNYEKLMGLEFLDCVLSETLRLHPPLPYMNKICTKEFTFPKTELNSKELTIEVGTPVIVPIRDLHYDEEYYPDPTKFDPERFRKEVKLENPKCTYMPFGEGPRICIGRKYAEMELKLGIAKILAKYKISASKMMKEPLKYESEFFLQPIGELWIKFEKL